MKKTGYTLLLSAILMSCTNSKIEIGDTQITIQEEKEPLRIYITQIDVIDFPQTNQEGAGWDPLDNSAPDIKIDVSVSGNSVYTSDPVTNAINSSDYRFVPEQPIVINPKANVAVKLYDEEFWVEPTFIGGWETGVIWSDFLKGRGYPESVVLGQGDLQFSVYFSYEL